MDTLRPGWHRYRALGSLPFRSSSMQVISLSLLSERRSMRLIGVRHSLQEKAVRWYRLAPCELVAHFLQNYVAAVVQRNFLLARPFLGRQWLPCSEAVIGSKIRRVLFAPHCYHGTHHVNRYLVLNPQQCLASYITYA